MFHIYFVLRGLVCCAFMVMPVSWSYAGALTAGVALGLPVEIAEVTMGGTWVDGAATGSFRTVTVQINGEPETAEVFVQWIGSRSPLDPVQIISSVALREFNQQNVVWASVVLEAEQPGTAQITVTGQDSQARPVGPLVFIASLPGVYHAVTNEAQR